MEKLLEAILFMKGEPVTIKELAALAKVEKSEVEEALTILSASLEGRGISLIRKDDEVMLATSPQFSDFFRDLAREEQIGRAHV